jgi:acyl carrier protein
MKDIEEKLLEILKNNSKVENLEARDLNEITFNEMGVNSLNFIKIIVELEEAFDIEFDDEQINYGLLNNIHDLIVLIEEKRGQKD